MEDRSAFWRAIADGDAETVGVFLQQHPEIVHEKRGWGSTPLHNAAMGGRKEIAKLLIAQGADVNARNELGDTPLRIALKYEKWEVAALIRENEGTY
jgi:uncharacterized protein